MLVGKLQLISNKTGERKEGRDNERHVPVCFDDTTCDTTCVTRFGATLHAGLIGKLIGILDSIFEDLIWDFAKLTALNDFIQINAFWGRLCSNITEPTFERGSNHCAFEEVVRCSVKEVCLATQLSQYCL